MSLPRRETASILLCLVAAAGAHSASAEEPAAAARLGEALFADQRFTNPAADYEASCSGCHVTGEPVSDRSERFFADYTPRSLTAMKQTTEYNTPTLLDLGKAERFGWRGSWTSLEELVAEKLTGDVLGWGEGDRERARDAIHFTLLEEAGPDGTPYVALFREAYDVDLETLGPDEAVQQAVVGLADYVRSIESTETARWDAFRTQNRIDRGPNEGESPQSYAGRIEGRIGNLEGRLQVKRPEGFSEEAYRGFKIFFNTFDDTSAGNCVACHTPPSFTDFELHDAGISQLGGGEPTEFKTPTLRNLSRTDPYMHDGAYATLEEVLEAKAKTGEMARRGELPGIDPEVAKIHLSKEDIAPLAAFLRQLAEVGEEDFRYFLIHFDS